MLISDAKGLVTKDRILIYIDGQLFGAIPLTNRTFPLLSHLLNNDESTAIFEKFFDMQISIFKAGNYVKIKLSDSDGKLTDKTILSRFEFLSLLESIALEARSTGEFSYKYIFIDEVEKAVEKYKETSEYSEIFDDYNFLRFSKEDAE